MTPRSFCSRSISLIEKHSRSKTLRFNASLGFENLQYIRYEKACGGGPSVTKRGRVDLHVCGSKKKEGPTFCPQKCPMLCFDVCLSCTDISNGWMTLQAALSQQSDEQSLSRRRSYFSNAFKSESFSESSLPLNNINERSYWSSSKGSKQGRRFNLCRNSSVRPQGSLHRRFQVTPSSSS